MTDQFQSMLARYALNAPTTLDKDAHDEVTRRVLDVLGIALGSLDQPAAIAARRYVESAGSVGNALIWGTGIRTSPQSASVANGAAVRCIDFNDGYMGLGDGSHPSDVIAPLIAVAECYGKSGQQVAVAVAIAYEIVLTMSDAMSIRRPGFDHVNVEAIAVVCALARLMDLTEEQAAQAIAISAVAHVALRKTRNGQITMWKSVAAPNGMRNAIEACLLAKAGVEGPAAPFEGEKGYFQVLTAGQGPNLSKFDAIRTLRAPRRILDANLKLWPLGQVAQTSVDVAVKLHARIPDPQQIEKVEISTFAAAAEIMDSPEKWRPTTRETADHSLVYATIAGLVDGMVTNASFHEDRLGDPRILRLLDERVSLVVLDDFTAMYPESQPARIKVTLKSGEVVEGEARYPGGHARNRPEYSQVAAKYRSLAGEVLGARADELETVVRNLNGLKDINELTRLVAAPVPARR